MKNRKRLKGWQILFGTVDGALRSLFKNRFFDPRLRFSCVLFLSMPCGSDCLLGRAPCACVCAAYTKAGKPLCALSPFLRSLGQSPEFQTAPSGYSFAVYLRTGRALRYVRSPQVSERERNAVGVTARVTCGSLRTAAEVRDQRNDVIYLRSLDNLGRLPPLPLPFFFFPRTSFL